MDPLHPLVPIQPASPVPPDYTRVQRIARDQQRESDPEWQRSHDEDAEDEPAEERFEDDYDPNWSDTTAAEAYNDHGELTEGPGANEPEPDVRRSWNTRVQGERRARPGSHHDPDDPEPGPHIDIIA